VVNAVTPLTVTSEVDEHAWDAFVDAHPAASGYHTWRWRRVFERAFGHRTIYLAGLRGDTVVGVLPLAILQSRLFGRSAVSLPFVNYGGVLADDQETSRALLEAAARIASTRGLAHIELRHRSRRFPDLRAKQHKAAMIMPLPSDAGSAWSGLDRKVRNQIRKAEKSGLTAMVGGGELLDRFYSVFANNMRDLGTPVYGRRVFREVFDLFPECTCVYLVNDGAVPVAAGIGYRYRDVEEIPWAGSLKSYRTRCPNYLMYWTAIQRAIAGGLSAFDFGRSTIDEGTFQFKRQWGAEAHPLCWEYRLSSGATLPDQSPKNPKFKAAISLWKRLPLPVANLIGPSIVRSLP
jgi:FemAB-related protein (PEP-CTERM system-associated)